MSRGRLVRIPSEKETEKAKASNTNAYFPSVGRYFTSKDGKVYVTLSFLPDVIMLMQEDKPKEEKNTDAPPF